MTMRTCGRDERFAAGAFGLEIAIKPSAGLPGRARPLFALSRGRAWQRHYFARKAELKIAVNLCGISGRAWQRHFIVRIAAGKLLQNRCGTSRAAPALTALSRGRVCLRHFVRTANEMAHPKRFELLTPRFVVWCSIQLSYGCVLRARTYSGPSPKASSTRAGLGHGCRSHVDSLQVSVETCQFPPKAAFWSLVRSRPAG